MEHYIVERWDSGNLELSFDASKIVGRRHRSNPKYKIVSYRWLNQYMAPCPEYCASVIEVIYKQCPFEMDPVTQEVK